MREYKLSPIFFSQMRRRVLIISVPFMVMAAVVGLLIAYRRDSSSSPIDLLITCVIVAIAIFFGFRKGLHKQQQMWSSYRLIADENSIKRTQDGLPDITINYSDIFKVTEAPGIGLTVQTSVPSRRISVPATLEDYSEFRLDLGKRHEIDKTARSRTRLMQLFSISYGLLTLAAVAITFLATNRYVVIVIGTLLFVAQLLGLVIIQRSTFTTKQVKMSSWLVLLVLAIIAVRVFYAFSGR